MDVAGNLETADGVVKTTVEGLGYELVGVERSGRGLLRVYIDRLPGQTYLTGPGAAINVDDCAQVTRQLQLALEVDQVDYTRLEVSSPGLDRPLRKQADYQRFAGQEVQLVLREPFEGRKAWKGVLAAADAGWSLQVDDGKDGQVLGFTLDEVREAKLVPVLDFKGRRAHSTAAVPAAQAAPAVDRGQDR